MSPLVVISVAVALAAAAAASIGFVMMLRRDASREARERAVAKAAREYLSQHGISSRTIGMLLADGSMVLMIETAPHKKLRFSFAIEPSIKSYVQKVASVELQRVFWRFLIGEAANKVPEVRYGKPTGAPAGVPTTAVGSEKAAAPAVATGDDLDDYLEHYDSYHIEEVSWNDFDSTVSGQDPSSTK